MAWSYSALTAFEQCPRRFNETRLLKRVADPQNEAALWGNRVHKALEIRLKSGEPISGALSVYDPYAAKIANAGGTVHAEQKIALNENLESVACFAKDVWVRGVIDVAVDRGPVVQIFDWKTGKRKPDSDQLELFAALGSVIYPEAKTFTTAFVWIKEKAIDKDVYTKADVPRIWDKFNRRVSKMDKAKAENTFPPNPSGLCRKWCPVSSCEFCGQ